MQKDYFKHMGDLIIKMQSSYQVTKVCPTRAVLVGQTLVT